MSLTTLLIVIMIAKKQSIKPIRPLLRRKMILRGAHKKTDYLEIRPLALKTDNRINGHIALSILAYNVMLKKQYTKVAKLDFKSVIRRL